MTTLGVGPITPRRGQYQRTFAPQTCRGLEAGSSRWLRLGTSVGRNCFLWWWLWTNPNLRSLTKTYVRLGKQKVLAMLSLYKAHLPCWLCFTIYDICNWWGPTDVLHSRVGLSLSLVTRVESLNWLALSNLSHCSYRTTISSVDGSV